VTDKPEPLREVIARHGLRASKALGQNFILDRQLLAKIAAIPGEIEGEVIYEVGPGPGGLTRALLERGARVVAVERDRRFLPALSELGADFPGNLDIVDAEKKQLIWEGVSEGVVTEESLANPKVKVNAVVTELMRRYPGKPNM